MLNVLPCCDPKKPASPAPGPQPSEPEGLRTLGDEERGVMPAGCPSANQPALVVTTQHVIVTIVVVKNVAQHGVHFEPVATVPS